MKIGDELTSGNKTIKFINLKEFKNKNYLSLIAEFKIKDNDSSFILKPELRVYNQPETITSEADIKTSLYSDNFIVFNILKEEDYFNVRYQNKTMMIWIWISALLISIGGLQSLIRKKWQEI